MIIRQAVDAAAKDRPRRPFLLGAETGNAISFEQMRERCARVARMLQRAGLAHGDKVGLLLDNGLRTVELFLGAMYGGFVAVPLNVRAGAMQLTYMLEHCDARVVFAEEQYRELLGEATAGLRRELNVIWTEPDGDLPEIEGLSAETSEAPGLYPVAPDDVALLMYSSGSTGKPKAAIHTHRSVLAHGRNSIAAHQLVPEDRSLLVLPMYHINAECVTLIPTLLSGGTVVVARRFTVGRFWDWIQDFEITWSALVPTILSELVRWEDPKAGHRTEALARIRFFRSSSAPLSPALQRQFMEKFSVPLLQAMGSTEGGNVFSNPVPPSKNKIGSPGLPWGFETRIVDRDGVDVAAGESGEVLLRGEALLRGYYKDAEGTAAVLDSEGWLHTGDLAQQDEDGYFFIVGRSKELIIKGGINIAPRQLDEVLEAHPAVLEAAAVGVPDRYFGEDAVAFVVLHPGAEADERQLLAFCETRLGQFKTPSRIHFLRELPKGPSGKVQRLRLLDPEVLSSVARTSQPDAIAADGGSALPEADGQGAEHAASLVEATSIEATIAHAWANVLKLAEVDRQANFFALGGHSLLAIQCLSQLRERLPVTLSIADFFEQGTVAAQAAWVRERMQPPGESVEGAASRADWERRLLCEYVAPAAAATTVHPREPGTRTPLSQPQQRLWFLERLNAGVPVYNEAEAVRLTGDLDVDALETAFNMLVARHEILRSTIQVIEGVPHAVVHDAWTLRLDGIDLSALPKREQQIQVDRLLVDKPKRIYYLGLEPGIRVALIKLGAREHVLILMMHHIFCDWSSEGIIWRELSVLYRSLLRGDAVDLPALPISQWDYAAWQQQCLTQPDVQADLAFWTEKLANAPRLLELPADRPRPNVTSNRGSRLRWNLSAALTEKLRKTSQGEKVSLFTVFAAALNTLIYRYTGTDDVLLGIPLADRDLPELQSVIGLLLQTHVLRTRLAHGMSFRSLLQRVQKETLDLYTHRAAPFEEIVRAVQHERNLSYAPLFQVMLNWRDREQALPFIGIDGLAIESLMAHSETTKFDLLFFVTDIGDEIWVELEYSTDLFDPDRMHRMLGHYQTLLESVVLQPEAALETFAILPESERQQVLHGWNATGAVFPAEQCVHHLFEDQVVRAPKDVAVVFEGDTLTYAELNARANQLAAYLRSLGVMPDTRVAVCLERGFEMVIALLGILKSGSAYVPLDPTYPKDRLRFMIEDAAPVVTLTQTAYLELLPESGPGFEIFDLSQTEDWQHLPSNNTDIAGLSARHLAYVIYTSGSTGQPKGVMVEHHGVCNRLQWMLGQHPISNRDAVLQKTPFGFDVSVWEFFWPLASGARLVMARPEGHKDPDYLTRTIREQRITTTHFVPSMLQAFLEHRDVSQCSMLERVVCSGEALSGALVRQFQERLPNATLHNLYGPTEASIEVTAFACPPGIDHANIPIGRPISNTRMYVLDAQGQPMPIGVPGELYIGGVQVARGYLHREDLTAERFLADPFSPEPDARMYRTGDLAKWMADGNIVYLGRNDFQVKIRGFRIELGEIEARIREYGAVRDVAVLAREDTPGDKRLVAYYTAAATADPQRETSLDLEPLDLEQLRSHLSATLPEYMLPQAYVRMASFPLTSSGKLDRKAFPAPEFHACTAPVYEPPQGETETLLAQQWADLLKVDRVGRNDNFFDLGGHSLLLIRLYARINEEFGLELPITTIFDTRTMAALATLIRERIQVSPIVPVQTLGRKPPIFMVYSYLLYQRLSHSLGTDQPFYGVREVGEEETLIEARALRYISEMKQVQPSGPYRLAGWCASAPMAVEIARQLLSSGEEVAAVILLDASMPGYTASHVPTSTEGSRLANRNRWARYRSAVNRFRSLRPQTAQTKIKRRVNRFWKELYLSHSASMKRISTKFHLPLPRFMDNATLQSYKTLNSFRRDSIPVRLTLIRATDGNILEGSSEALGWDQVAGRGVQVLWAPGDHVTMFLGDNLRATASLIEQSLSAECPLFELRTEAEVSIDERALDRSAA